MSKTAKVVIVFSAIALVCLIGAGIVLGVYFNRSGTQGWSGLRGDATEVYESAQLSIEDAQKLSVECDSANIEFVKADSASVTLVGKIWARDAQEKYLVVEQNADSIRIVFDIEPQKPFNIYTADITMTIYLPADNMLDLDISNSSGNLTMSDMGFGDIAVRNSSGNSEISNITAAAFDYRLTSGNTKITSSRFDSLDVNCSSGTVKIYDTVADTKVVCTSGGVLLDGIDGSVDVKATSGNVTVNMASANIEPITIGITSGNCKLGLYEDSAFDLTAKVTSGNISLDIPVEISGSQSKNSVIATRNGGGVPINLKSTSGNITIATID